MSAGPPGGSRSADPEAVPPRPPAAPADPWAVPPRSPAAPADPWAVPPPPHAPEAPPAAPPPRGDGAAPSSAADAGRASPLSAGTDPARDAPAGADPSGGTPWLRLHPLTPLLRGGRVLVLVAVVVYQQVLREAGVAVGAALLGAALPVAVVYGWVSWRRTRYRIADGDLQVETGVLVRRSRRVPLARLQAVDLVRGPVARLAGLAELRLEVVGGDQSEAPLAYLAEPDAAALRARLLTLARGAAPQAQRAPQAPRAGSPLLAVPPGRLLAGTLLTGPALVAGVLLVACAVTLAVEPGARGAVAATLVPVLLGSGGVLLRRLAGEWGFVVEEAPDGLRLRHGLVETRAQTIPRDRVQGLRVSEPLLWRPLGWVRVEVDVAGYGSGAQEEQARTRALVPVAAADDAQRVLDAALPGTATGLLSATRDPGAGRPPRRALVVAPLGWWRLGVTVHPAATWTSGGLLQRVTDVVPHAKVQSLRLVQGPLQRRLRLASLHLDTAGRYVAGRAPHRDAGESERLLAELVERTRRSRGEDAPGPAVAGPSVAGPPVAEPFVAGPPV